MSASAQNLPPGTDNHRQPVNQRILVIDDNDRVLTDFRRILSMSGRPGQSARLGELEAALFDEPTPQKHTAPSFHVETAVQGQQGVALVERGLETEQPYAVAFVDIRMPPGWDGIETTRRIWYLDENIQVVLCTAYSDYSWEEIADQLGFTDQLLLLKKPFDAIEIRQLATALTAKWSRMHKLIAHSDKLERLVDLRTHELEASSAFLHDEMQQRLQGEDGSRDLQRLKSFESLSTSIDHDINNSLCFLTGHLELLTSSLADLPTGPTLDEFVARARSDIETAAQGARRIAQLASAVHGFMGTDDRAAVAAVEPTIATAVELTQNYIRHRAQLVQRIHATPVVRIDQRALAQVLVHLLLDATRALPPVRATARKQSDHEIVSEFDHEIAPEIAIDVPEPDGDFAHIVISNTTPGVASTARDSSVEPCSTTHGSRDTAGLATCREIIEAAGGLLQIDQAANQGRNVRISLPTGPISDPVAVDAGAIGVMSPTPANSTTPYRILVVSDEARLLDMLQRALEGYRVERASGGRDALALCRRETFDLILCDAMMPDLGGHELFQALGSDRPELASRCLFMSGGTFMEPTGPLPETNERPHVRKPFSIGELRAIVAAFFRDHED